MPKDSLNQTQMAAKRCPACQISKPETEFYATVAKCKPCHREYCRQYSKANPRRGRVYPEHQVRAKRSADLKKRMGITLDEQEAMLAEQGGVCAICGSPESFGRGWCTDHDHACCPMKAKSCGECIRGILCYRCNTLLGHAKDNTETLLSAVEYLRSRRA